MISSTTYKYLFLLIVTFYCLVLSQFGLENFDTGFISSFSWRIINGQDVYQDFLYKFPPVTIYFHAFFMKILPITAQFFFFRVIDYSFFALQVFFIVSGYNNLYNLKKLNINKWGLMSVCFIISLLNFPPCPWTTTDGLFFVSIAFWIVSINKTNISFIKLFLIALLCMLSALSKQSFYLVPLVFLFWIYIKYGLKQSLVFLSLILILALVFYNLILSITTWSNFIKQTTGETNLHQLFQTGLHNYLFISVKLLVIILFVLCLVFGVYLYITKKKIVVLFPFLKWISIVLFSIAVLLLILKEAKVGSRIAFDACIIAVLYTYLTKKKNIPLLAPICVALFIAWSSSISLGYAYPILFTTGIIMSFIVLMIDEIKIKSNSLLLIAITSCAVAFSYNLRPYREKNIFSLTYPLEKISPKLKYIKTNKESFEKYSELKELIHKYGDNFIVAPSFPMANYLFNNQSELPADWIINSEINRRASMFIRIASEKKNYVFLEKSFLNHEEFVTNKIEDFSYISYFIHEKFNMIEETNHFIIYNSLKKNEKLP